MDTPDPDLLARLAALDESERREVLSFLAHPDEIASNPTPGASPASDDSAPPLH